MEIRYQEFTHPSACGEGDVFARSWLPDTPPKAIIQIAHGMQEHAGRYDRFARHLAEHGWAVYANDHIGHGRSTMGHMGTFSLKPGGFEFLLQDMHSLFEIAEKNHPGLPVVLFGHSMGSIASGIYPRRFDDAQILILMGTPASNPMVGLGIAMAGSYAKLKGPTAISSMMTKMASANIGSGGSSDPMVANAWLSRDENEVRKATEDPLFGNPFSASAYRELFLGIREFGGKNWGSTVPDIPILITAGGDDSCGNRGAAPKHYYDALIASGHHDVTLKIYDGAHHELLNEINRDEVEEMIFGFITEKLAAL